MNRKADALQMPGHAICRSRRAETSALGEAEGLHHADGHAFAMEQRCGIAGGRFQRMAEGVAEIEQCAHACFGLVLGHDRSLGLAGAADGMNARLRGRRA